MRILMSFIGNLQQYLGDDLRWLGVIESPNVETPLEFRLLPWGGEDCLTKTTMPKLNPSVGGTGLAKHGNFIVSALQWHTPSFAVFNLGMNYLAMPNSLVEDVHSIAFRENTLFATQTLRDQVVSYVFPNFAEGEVIYDFKTGDNKHHLNSVAVSLNDEVLMAFHRDPLEFETIASAVVINLSKNEMIDLPGRIRRLHSLVGLEENRIAFCDSMSHQFWTGRSFIPTIGYPRGLARYGDYFIVGSSRLAGGNSDLLGQCAIQIFHADSGYLVNQILIPERWEIYDILVLD